MQLSELPATGDAEAANLEEFERQLKTLTMAIKQDHHGIIWLYPSSAQAEIAKRGKEWLPERPKVEKLAKSYGLRVVDVAANAEWTGTLYRDGVHPTIEGNKVLASILASEIMRDLER
jgi:lysophospholipase L1-like esterase